MFPKLLGTFAAQALAERYDADPARRTGGGLDGFPASRTANLNTESRTASSLSCACTATVDNSTRWRRPSSKRLRRSTRPASRNTRRGICKVLFLPAGDRGYRTYLLSDSETQPGTRTVPPPPTSLSVSPAFPRP